MKRIILSIVAICAMVTVSAQEFSLGIKAGINVASPAGDIAGKDMETSSRIGFVAGVTGEYTFTEKSAFSVDLLYSLQGFKQDLGLDDDLKYNLSYLNIPILYNYYIFEGLAVKAGIQPGFLLSAKISYDGDSKKIDNTNLVSFAIPIGVSYTFAEKVVFDARYNIACSNIDNDDDFTSRNNVFQLTVGYKF